MAYPAHKMVRTPLRLTDAAIKRLIGFPYIRSAISRGLERVSPTDVHVPKGGRFVSFRLADPASFHPALYATMRVGHRGTLLTIGTPKAMIRNRARLEAFLARMGWDARVHRWKRTLSEGQRRSLVYQLKAGGIIGGSRAQRVLVPISRVEAVVRRYAGRPEVRRAVAVNPLTRDEQLAIWRGAVRDARASARSTTIEGSAMLYGKAERAGQIAYHYGPGIVPKGMVYGAPRVSQNAHARREMLLTADEKKEVTRLEAERARLLKLLERTMPARTFRSIVQDVDRLNRRISQLKYGASLENKRRAKGKTGRNPILATLGFNPQKRKGRWQPVYSSDSPGWSKHMAAPARHALLSRLVRRDGYATIIRRLNWLINVSHDEATRAAARADMRWLQSTRGRVERRVAMNNEPGVVGIRVPFRDGQKVTPKQIERWLDSLPPGVARQLRRRYGMSQGQSTRFHLKKPPRYYTFRLERIGSQDRITDVDFVVSEGKEWAAMYQVPPRSGKYDRATQGRYIHSHGESGIDIKDIKRPVNPSRLPERFHTPDGKFAGVLIGRSPVKIGAWYEK